MSPGGDPWETILNNTAELQLEEKETIQRWCLNSVSTSTGKRSCDLEMWKGLIFQSLYQILSPKQSGNGESGALASTKLLFTKCSNILVFIHITDKSYSSYHYSFPFDIGGCWASQANPQGHKAIQCEKDKDSGVDICDTRNDHLVSKLRQQNWRRVSKH